MTKTDIQLKQDIEDELRWDPRVNAARIGVSVESGVVSLLGAVDSYAEKGAAEVAARRVSGVRAIAQDLTVKVLDEHARTDLEIAAAAQRSLEWDIYVPKTVTATVDHGAVTLAGPVTWNYQREAAAHAVRHLPGVVAVHNLVSLRPQASAEAVKEKVLAALERQAKGDTQSIHVEISGGKVTLTGYASSWQNIEDAAAAAWAAPGVTEVIDQVKLAMPS